jgi:hypothetical protein
MGVKESGERGGWQNSSVDPSGRVSKVRDSEPEELVGELSGRGVRGFGE